MKHAPIYKFHHILIACFFLSFPQLSYADDCPQGQAIYQDDTGLVKIEFMPTGGQSIASHQFVLTINKTIPIEGYVLLEGNPERPATYLPRNCPDGDVTGDELAACTVWSGVPYGINHKGNLGTLQDELAPAFGTLLLPDFARSLTLYSDIVEDLKLDAEPSDIFQLSSCGENQ